MTPKVEIFEKCPAGFRDGTPNYVSWPNLVKIGRCEVAERSSGLPHTKNSGSAGLFPAPILPKMGRSRPKFPERCQLLTCPRRPNLVRIGCALPDLFRKDWFFGPKSNYNRLSAYNNPIYKAPKALASEALQDGRRSRVAKRLPRKTNCCGRIFTAFPKVQPTLSMHCN